MTTQQEESEFLESKLKAEALALGFSICGITTPDPPDHFAVFESWLNSGNHADMSWLATEYARNLRQNPSNLLPGCKSIVIVAARYPLSFAPQSNNTGRIAAYALHQDYHHTLVARLNMLAEKLQGYTNDTFQWKAVTDSAPVLERELAQRAGIGWIGRNGCLISPRFGSSILLAELFLTLPLTPDKPFLEDYCGTCRRCLDACPTRCISDTRTLTARQCISYWTIESKQPIPDAISKNQFGWVFGCDICQQVCPWNIHARTQPDSLMLDNPIDEFVSTSKPQTYNDTQFKQVFASTPVARARSHGFRRNLLSIIRYEDEPRAIETARHMLMNDEHPLVRRQAVIILHALLGSLCFEILQIALITESDPTVREEIRSSLEKISRKPGRQSRITDQQ